jgi:hypothetical protein
MLAHIQLYKMRGLIGLRLIDLIDRVAAPAFQTPRNLPLRNSLCTYLILSQSPVRPDRDGALRSFAMILFKPIS